MPMLFSERSHVVSADLAGGSSIGQSQILFGAKSAIGNLRLRLHRLQLQVTLHFYHRELLITHDLLSFLLLLLHSLLLSTDHLLQVVSHPRKLVPLSKDLFKGRSAERVICEPFQVSQNRRPGQL